MNMANHLKPKAQPKKEVKDTGSFCTLCMIPKCENGRECKRSVEFSHHWTSMCHSESHPKAKLTPASDTVYYSTQPSTPPKKCSKCLRPAKYLLAEIVDRGEGDHQIDQTNAHKYMRCERCLPGKCVTHWWCIATIAVLTGLVLTLP